MLFKRKRKYTTYKPPYREPLTRRGLFKTRRTKPSPKIYRTTFREARLKTSSLWQRNFYKGVILIIIFFLIYLCLFSNLFSIKKIALVGNKEISFEQIEKIVNPILSETRLWFFSGRNIFLVNSGRITKAIQEGVIQIKSVEIKRKYPDILKIKIQEKIPKAIWVTGEKSYYQDEQGIICYEIPIEIMKDTDLPIIQDNLAKEVKPDDKVQTKEFLEKVQEIKRRFQPKTGYSIALFEVPSRMASEVWARTNLGFRVLFSINRDIDAQLNDLSTILVHQIKDRISSVEYIDLRIENWVYYK